MNKTEAVRRSRETQTWTYVEGLDWVPITIYIEDLALTPCHIELIVKKVCRAHNLRFASERNGVAAADIYLPKATIA
jgi:hypothetical protein